MIRDILQSDKASFLEMERDFFSSPAVAHNIDPKNFETTFEAAMNKSPFLRILILESDGMTAGYAILSFTYSNEAGGLVVLTEEIYIKDEFRGKGLGGEFFDFIEAEYPTAKRYRLEVVEGNERAIALYEKRGYKPLNYLQMIKDK